MIGTRIGPYDVLAKLGEGGMGEVYRARDTKLNRDVAIKVLPALFADDAERFARFTREAQTLASLNHPNIAQVYGLEESGGVRALVMELVAGEDLSDLVARGPIPLPDVLPIARQIAIALEAAHESGIVHRDLKPGNVKVAADGSVKVLDFGLAKALDPAGASRGDPANSPTLTARATQLGMILGTAAYMAPEQARGKSVDRRADIWAYGVVLFEMLTGQRAFAGEDITEVLAKVLEREPDLSALPAATPSSLRRLLMRCLVKDPKQRLRDIGEARLAIDEAAQELAHRIQPTPVGTIYRDRPAPRWRSVLPWGLVAGLAAVVAVLMVRNPAPALGSASVARLQITMPAGFELYTAVGRAISLSPDGSTLALVGVRGGVRQVFLRRLDSFELTPVRGTETAVSCVFSPDGRELLVGTADTALRRVRLADTLIELATSGNTSEFLGGWLPDGRVVFTREGRLWAAGSTAGSEPTQLTEAPIDPTEVELQPVPVPGTNAVLFAAGRREAPELTRIEALTLSDRKRVVVVERAADPMLTASGHLLFLRDGALLAAPFDRQTLTITGEARRVIEDLTIVRSRGVAAIATVSASGTLAYASPTTGWRSDFVSVSRTGSEQLVLSTNFPAGNPRITADGRAVMFEEIGGGLWLWDIERRAMTRLTDGSVLAAFPIFAPGGRSAIFRSAPGLFTQPLDGGVKPVQITGTGPNAYPNGLSPDGKDLFFTHIDSKTAGNVMIMPVAGGTARILVGTPAYEGGASLSPDGRWLLYVSNELGANEIFIQPYPALDRRFQVSSGGGVQPIWNPRGGEIFYRNADKVMSVRLTSGPTGPVLSSPVALFAGRYAYGGGLTISNFSATADGNHLVMVKEGSGASLNVVLNWTQELGRAQ